MANGSRILTHSNSKIMIRYGELTKILNATEIQQWHNILDKIRRFEEAEKVRKQNKKERLS